ncbi:tail fiber domain-containing protein [Mucilaginibacter sabulilitoris]|uniref:Tail fiber domain-containing protein n=1 Tax=Mucilaginibacter sabulilitoris TaxID=1173583 RepID=A0ABZ0TJ81_9SPHI|nr:tail fiber domain-containing protein [Mucilaginibacter sabulilitoris]WPU92253.1 tail fiber domain-containing protein [Mucilaginibacter sabulilitoris]
MKLPFQFILLFMLFSVVSKATFAQQVNHNTLKINATPIVNSLDYIVKLQPVSYEYDHNGYKQLNLPTGKQFGFTAHDAKLIVPSAVSNRNHWYPAGKGNQRAITTQEVNLEKLVPLLVGAVKEQQAQINDLRTEIEQLKKSK